MERVYVPLLEVISQAAVYFYRLMQIEFDIGGFVISYGGALIFLMILSIVLFVGRVLLS